MIYALHERKDGGAATQKVITPPTSEYHIGRVNGTYEFWVRACQTYETAICSESNHVTVTVSGSSVPLPPASIQSSASGCNGTQNPDGTWQRTYTISWSASTGAVRYRVHEKKGPSPPPVEQYHSTPALSHSFTGTHIRPLGGMSEWAYRVAACSGESDSTCSTFSESVYVCVGPTQINVVAPTTTYVHTDALHSPVAETNPSGAVTKRYTYEPYGAPGNGSYEQGPGYTGHVTDAATGLSYMQQRYYDPLAGRFLGMDPVGASPINGLNFNRYWYASNNPYKNIDPDGRCDGPATCAIDRDIAAMNSGDMSREEFMERSEARATGAAVGAAVVATAVIGSRALPLLKAALKPAVRRAVEETKKESKERQTPGRDGGQSTVTIERNASGEVISRTHSVKKDGEVVHQHQEQIGKHGGERAFPDEWTGTETINATPKQIDPKINEIK